MAELTSDIRETVRERYAAAALAAGDRDAGCCGPVSTADATGARGLRRRVLRRARTARRAVDASLGCGVPTAVAELHEGETVLDLGSGAGADVLISARRVGPTGRAIGLDMTDEMLSLARANARRGGRRERRVHQGLHRGDPARRTRPSTSSSPTASSTSPPTRPGSSKRPRACCAPAAASRSRT